MAHVRDESFRDGQVHEYKLPVMHTAESVRESAFKVQLTLLPGAQKIMAGTIAIRVTLRTLGTSQDGWKHSTHSVISVALIRCALTGSLAPVATRLA